MKSICFFLAASLLIASSTTQANNLPNRELSMICPTQRSLALHDGLADYERSYEYKIHVEQVEPEEFERDFHEHLVYGELPDLLCTTPSSASALNHDQWISALNELPAYKDIRHDMLPLIRLALSYNDTLLAMPLGVTVDNIVYYNEDALSSESGPDQLPVSWTQMYTQAIEHSAISGKPSLLPHWSGGDDTLVLRFLGELLNRNQAATIKLWSLHGQTARVVLSTWKHLLDLGVVPRDSLTNTAQQNNDRLVSENYLFAVRPLSLVFDKAAFRSQVNSPNITPLFGRNQHWGMLSIHALSLVDNPNRERLSTERLLDFLHWFSYRDENGHYQSSERWLVKGGLLPAYLRSDKDDRFRALLQSTLYRPEYLDATLTLYRRAGYPSSLLSQPWSQQLVTSLKPIILAFLNDEQDLNTTMNAIAAVAKTSADIDRKNRAPTWN